MNIEIFDYQKLPMRDTIHLTEGFCLVVWHDKDYVNNHYQISQFVKLDAKEDKRHYKVIASFISPYDLSKYMATIEWTPYL